MNRLPSVGTLTLVEGIPATTTCQVNNDGDPADLTGYSLLIQLRHKSSDNLIAEWTDASPEVTFTEATGFASLTIPVDESSTWTTLRTGVLDFYFYDADFLDPKRSDPIDVVWYDGVSVE